MLGRFGLPLLLSLGVSGCVSIGLTGDESPLTGVTRNLRALPMQPAWRRVMNPPNIQREKPEEFATAAYDPQSRRVWAGSSAGQFVCLDAANGATVWSAEVDGTLSGQAVFDGRHVLTGTDEGRLLALDPSSGNELWSYRVQSPITQAPVVSGDGVYFVDGNNGVYALGRDGKWRWQYRRDAPAEFALVGEGRPLVTGGRVHVGFSDGMLVTLDARDGAVVWTRDLSPEHDRFQDVDATPVVAGGLLLAASAAAGLYALDPASGDIHWTLPMDGIQHTAAVDDDLLVTLETGRVMRLDGRTGAVRWRTHLGDAGAPGEPTLVAGLVAVTTSRGGLHLLDARTGRPLQRFEPGSGIYARPAVGTDGSVFVLSNGGVLYALRPGRSG